MHLYSHPVHWKNFYVRASKKTPSSQSYKHHRYFQNIDISFLLPLKCYIINELKMLLLQTMLHDTGTGLSNYNNPDLNMLD